ncbi:MAG: hypothetical protein LBG72_02310 [Spirochaetaceae bacterium]|jgi:hypothetical protein|nr:hypothetical protein [Spirochaetaceae bacterium]
MKKTAAVFIVPLFFAAGIAPLFAQQKQQETSVEQSYLDESIELRIIRRVAESESRESKLQALDFIHDYLGAGNSDTAIVGILTSLSRQGTMNKERLLGSPIGNDYPDVRWRATEYLGLLPKGVVEDSLRYILLNEEEPEVAVAAVNSLAKVGSYDTDTVIAIEKSFRKFDAGRPSERLAIAVLDYYEAAPSPKPRYMADTIDYVRSSPNYDYRIRAKADKLLKELIKSFYKGD